MSEEIITPLPDAADIWVSEHWQDLFPHLGTYDFAREAFRAGAGTTGNTAREPGAAAGLVFAMFEQARKMQSDGGVKAELTVQVNPEAAKVMGFAGQGEIKLTLWPCKRMSP